MKKSIKETGKDGFQSKVKKRIAEQFPQCEVYKMDPNDTQGIPDLLLLCDAKWATLETKRSKNAKRQPNQPYYVEQHNKKSFSRFVSPENEEEVFLDLDKFLKK